MFLYPFYYVFCIIISLWINYSWLLRIGFPKMTRSACREVYHAFKKVLVKFWLNDRSFAPNKEREGALYGVYTLSTDITRPLVLYWLRKFVFT